MEAAAIKLPDSLPEDELLRIPASWEEYESLIDETPYTIQFLNNEIIMSQASRSHESLVMILGRLLSNYFYDQEEYDVLGSNVKIVIPGRVGDFNADVSVVKEPIKYGLTASGAVSTMRIENPAIVIEVLSNSTRRFDLNEKLEYYKQIPSLKHVLFVDQNRPFATTYSQTDVPDEWLNHDYHSLDATVRLGELTLPMAEIYRKTVFDA